jgi:hypothetical protein
MDEALDQVADGFVPRGLAPPWYFSLYLPVGMATGFVSITLHDRRLALEARGRRRPSTGRRASLDLRHRRPEHLLDAARARR